MFWMFQLASVPINRAHKRIKLAQNHSKLGAMTIVLAHRRQAGHDSLDSSPFDRLSVNFATISLTPVTFVFSSFQGSLIVILLFTGVSLGS